MMHEIHIFRVYITPEIWGPRQQLARPPLTLIHAVKEKEIFFNEVLNSRWVSDFTTEQLIH